MDESDEIFAALQRLGDIEAIAGVVVFGSLARNEMTDSSDMDIILVHDGTKDITKLRAAIRSHIAADPVLANLRPIYYSLKAFMDEINERPSFAAHLADEGMIVHRTAAIGLVERALGAQQLTRSALQRELAARLSKLELFSDLRRFNGEFISCLAQLYSIGRAVVIVKLLENDIHEYSWKRIFDAYSSVRPELNEDIEHLAALRAYYEYVRNRSELPQGRRDIAPRYVDEAISAITTVAAS